MTDYIDLSTGGDTDVIDITREVEEKMVTARMKNGVLVIHVIGSTAALTTCEFEPGLVEDLKHIFDKLIPEGHYAHDRAWGDGNGHSHLRASLLGPSLTIPFNDKKLILGTWQQIIFIDFDNRPRERRIVLQFMGE